MKLRIVALLLCITTSMGRSLQEGCTGRHCDTQLDTTTAIANEQEDTVPSLRGALEDCRSHCDDDGPAEKDVDITDEVDGQEPGGEEEEEEEEGDKQFSNVECLPDGGGSFGDTTDKRSIVIYAFGVETFRTELDEIVEAVTTSVEDMLIDTFFDDECNEISGIVGFKFEPEDDLTVEYCPPLVDNSAVCSIIKVVIEVYGDNPGAESKIVDYLALSSTRDVHPDILRLYPASYSTEDPEAAQEEQTQPPIIFNPSPTSNNNKSGGLQSGGAIAGIVICLMLLTLGVIGYIYFEHRRRHRTGDSVSSLGGISKKDTSSNVSDARSVISQDLKSLPTVGIEGGRPVFVENYLPRAEL